MTKRSCPARATARLPLGSAVLLKSRLERYLESFRLATGTLRGADEIPLDARVAPAGQRLLADQALGSHGLDDMRTLADPIGVSFELGAYVNANMGAPGQHREQVGIGNRKLIT